MKKILYLLLSIISIECIAQSQTEKTSIYVKDGVEIIISEQDCIDKQKGIEKQLLVIELINQNEYPVLLTFKKELWYDNICNSCNSESHEHIVTQNIDANTNVSGGCSSSNKSLNVFVKMLNLKDVRQLTNYEFKDIKIEKAK